MARRRFFVESIHGDMAELEGEDARHLARVLRAEAGQEYEISDNRAVYLAVIRSIHRDRVVFQVRQSVAPRTPATEVVFYAALIKFDRFEWMLEKLTELGVAEIVPVEAVRSEKGLNAAAQKRLERWRRIAREASQQSRRDCMPEVHAPVGLSVALDEAAAQRYFLDEAEGAPPLCGVLPPPGARRPGERLAVLAGPEGGWTEPERTRCVAAGWTPVSLGPQILRTETAAMAALSVLTCTWWAGCRETDS